MSRIYKFIINLAVFLLPFLISACGPLLAPAQAPGGVPTPVGSAGPSEPSGGKLVADPVVFINLLQQGLTERDKAALQSMMGDTFTLAFWRSEGMQVTPGEAIQQILNNYVPDGAAPVLDPDHPVIASLFAEPTITEAGEELIPVHVSGWGDEGQGEAILFIARRANGSLYWQGALTALGGFGE